MPYAVRVQVKVDLIAPDLFEYQVEHRNRCATPQPSPLAPPLTPHASSGAPCVFPEVTRHATFRTAMPALRGLGELSWASRSFKTRQLPNASMYSMAHS